MDIREQLIRHEGLRLKPYQDTVGKLTVGVGRNLDDVGITKDEAMVLLDNDIDTVVNQCEVFSWYSSLSDVRKMVIIDMVFNLGITRFSRFKKTIAYLAEKNYELAAIEMLNSKWAVQVGGRATTLSSMMKNNIET